MKWRWRRGFTAAWGRQLGCKEGFQISQVKLDFYCRDARARTEQTKRFRLVAIHGLGLSMDG